MTSKICAINYFKFVRCQQPLKPNCRYHLSFFEFDGFCNAQDSAVKRPFNASSLHKNCDIGLDFFKIDGSMIFAKFLLLRSGCQRIKF